MGEDLKITTIMSAFVFIEVIELNYISVTVVKMRQDWTGMHLAT